MIKSKQSRRSNSDMATQFDCFNEAILGKLSQIGIEIFNDKNNEDLGNLLPKTIYEITKDSSNINYKNEPKK